MRLILRNSILLFYLLSTTVIYAQYPLIQSTRSYVDDLFNQQQQETESWYYNNARGLSCPPLSIYRYKTQKNDSLIMLAASFNLPVDTLATINGIENMNEFKAGEEIIIPSAPGLYLHKDSESSWITSLRKDLDGIKSLDLILFKNGKKIKVDYYQGVNLPASYKTRFVLPLFASPLDKRAITSSFGFRNHPVTGKWQRHTGTDYRASLNSPIYSCADGTIFSTGELEDYGKFVIIKHRNGYSSLYSHLEKILVNKDQKVLEGEMIAKSGNTGISTGPHLHFEIRQNGSPVDPENLLLKDRK
jgi:murein DD-endopeptidase MepM/ murein hydrolase activator NlpD